VPLSGVIDLPGVNFRSNSNILLDGANTALDAAALILLDNPDINVEVAGHTDSDGDPVVNGTLSLARALVVRDYLIGVGVSPSRIRAHGYGDTEPLADNATEAGRATNRRVELRVKNRQ
jgi:OOP family OmpA-OmpF porin